MKRKEKKKYMNLFDPNSLPPNGLILFCSYTSLSYPWCNTRCSLVDHLNLVMKHEMRHYLLRCVKTWNAPLFLSIKKLWRPILKGLKVQTFRTKLWLCIQCESMYQFHLKFRDRFLYRNPRFIQIVFRKCKIITKKCILNH